MNKKLLIGFGILVLGLVVNVGYAAYSDQTVASGGSGVYYLNGQTATTTSGVTFLTAAGASTTLAMNTIGISSINLNTQFTPSTTAGYLNYSVSFANGGSTNCVSTPDACDWYPEDATSVSGAATTHASSSAYHQWAPQVGISSTSTRNFVISSVGNRFTRVQFQANGSAGAVWAAATLKP